MQCMSDWNGICKSAVQIRYIVNINHRTQKRHAAWCPADAQQSVKILCFNHIFCFSGNAVRCDLLADHALFTGFLKCFEIKWKDFAWVLVKNHVHIQKTLFTHEITKIIVIVVFFIFHDHTVSCTPNLFWHVIHGITCSCRNTNNVGEISILFHKII